MKTYIALFCAISVVKSADVFSTCSNNCELGKIPDIDRQRQEFIEHQNQIRALHCVAPISLSEDLNRQAQSQAEKYAKLGKISKPAGAVIPLQNKTLRSEGLALGASIYWYRQGDTYDYSNPIVSSENWGFVYTVYKSIKHVGVGLALNEWYAMVILRYAPDLAGELSANVLKRCSKSPYETNC